MRFHPDHEPSAAAFRIVGVSVDEPAWSDDVTGRDIGVVIMAVVLTGVGAAAFAQSGHHGDGHAEGHDIYKNWSPPNNPNTSCCNNGDCRPTRAYVDSEGHWRAWNGNLWLVVPQERVLPPDLAGDGRSHICEKGQFIYCFSPGEIRS